MAAVTLLGSTAMADSVTFDFVNKTYGYDVESGNSTNYMPSPCDVISSPVTLNFSKSGTADNAGYRFWSDGLRTTKGAGNVTIKVSAADANITGITVTFKAAANVSSFKIEGATLTAKDNVYTWTGDVTVPEIVYACSKTATMTSMTVDYELTAADALAAPVISMEDGANGYQVVMTAEEGADIYYTENETEPTTASPKYTKPIEVWMKTTFKAIAVKDGKTSSVATFVAVPPTVVEDFMSLYGFVDYVSAEGEQVEVRSNMVAVYDYLAPAGGYLYLYDGQNYMLFYNSPAPAETVAPGTTFNKVEGLFKVYNGLPEMTKYTLGEPTGTAGVVPAPTMLELDAIGANMVNHYIKVEDVKVALELDEKGKTTITATDKTGNSVALYDRFGLDIKDMESADITGFVSVFGDTVQIYPTLIAENENTGVSDIAVDNSAAEYYTLQGVRVANPENGIYIVRQGGKVFKTVIK